MTARKTGREDAPGATYALYKGDEFVDVGTADELAERRGVRSETIRWMASPSYRKRGYGKKVMAYRVV